MRTKGGREGRGGREEGGGKRGGRVGREERTNLLVEREKDDAADGQAAEEPGRDVSGAGPPTALVDDEGDDPAPDGNLDADVCEQEERHEVYGAQAEDLLVLVHASQRLFRLLMWGLADFLQAVCRHEPS